MQNVTSQKCEKCQPFCLNSFFPTLRKVVCASPHNAFYCRAKNVERGWGAGPSGVRPLSPLGRAFLRGLQRGEERGHISSCSPCCWDRHGHHFTFSRLKWRFRESTSRKCSQIFDLSLCSREGRTETVNSWWALNSILLKIFSSLGRKGVTWPEMA